MATSAGTATTPAEIEAVVRDGKRYTPIKEGLATILLPCMEEGTEQEKAASTDKDASQRVFYNPIQQFNRDLSVLAIKAYGHEVIEKRRAAFEEQIGKFSEIRRKRKERAKTTTRPTKTIKLSDNVHTKERGDGSEEPPRILGDGDRGVLEENSEYATPFPADAAPRGGVDAFGRPAHSSNSHEVPNGNAQRSAADNGETGARSLTRFTILDALSATGLRALRYAHEIPFVTSVTSNDLLQSAVNSIKLNVSYNGLDSKINVGQDDAVAHMYSLVARELRRRDPHRRPHKSEKYDVIDLDPYGTAAVFFDAAVQAVRDDGGLLCVTCTDAGVWASNGYPEKAFSLYGGVSMKGEHSHEAGLRLILHALATSAARYGLVIEPLLSLSIDYYGRLFVRVRRSPAAVKFQASKTMIVYTCDAGCGAWATQPMLRSRSVPNKRGSGEFYKHSFSLGPTTDRLCEHCGSKTHVAGPMYAGRLHSPAFIRRILDQLATVSSGTYGTMQRIEGVLQTALEEVMLTPEEETGVGEVDTGNGMAEDQHQATRPTTRPNGRVQQSLETEIAAIDPCPFFFIPSQLASVLRCATPPESPLRGALLGLGYRVTRSHCKRGSMKTDAPWSVIWRVMREWIRQKAPVKKDHLKVGMAGYRLLGLDVAGQPKDPRDIDPIGEGGVEVIFDEKRGRYPEAKLVRYQMNPRENWGPMARARG